VRALSALSAARTLLGILLVVSALFMLALQLQSPPQHDLHESSDVGQQQASQKVALMVVAVLPPDTAAQLSYIYWVSLASKHAYSAAHGYPLYALRESLSEQPVARNKFIAMRAVMAHSDADWVW
jgi:hypothetical protein